MLPLALKKYFSVFISHICCEKFCVKGSLNTFPHLRELPHIYSGKGDRKSPLQSSITVLWHVQSQTQWGHTRVVSAKLKKK